MSDIDEATSETGSGAGAPGTVVPPYYVVHAPQCPHCHGKAAEPIDDIDDLLGGADDED